MCMYMCAHTSKFYPARLSPSLLAWHLPSSTSPRSSLALTASLAPSPLLLLFTPQGLLGRVPNTEQSNLELEQMRMLCEKRQDEINVLRNQLEQKDSAMEMLRQSYDDQVRGGASFCVRGLVSACGGGERKQEQRGRKRERTEQPREGKAVDKGVQAQP